VKGFEQKVRDGLRAAAVAPGGVVLAAVSGGPDSTALLRALVAACPSLDLTLHACTIDHGMRPPAETHGDTAFVRDLCAEVGVPLAAAGIPAGTCAARARAEHRSLEEVAREMRHEILRREAAKSGARDIALGHTRDDLLETLLMRIFQGSDPEGLRGTAPRRGPFVRPLLACTRAEVLEYLASLRQRWREDPSNQDERFLRNSIRHTLVPALEISFPGWKTGLLSLSRKVGLAHDVVQAGAEELPWAPEGKGFVIDHAIFAQALPAVRARSLMMIYDRFRGALSPRRLPWRFLGPALLEEVPPRMSLRGHGARLEARGERVRWGPDIASRGEKGYFIEVNPAVTTAAGETGLHVLLAHCAAGSAAGQGVLSLLEENVKPPLVLRSRRKGDEVQLAGGVTSVKELLDRWGVPEPARDDIPLLADRRGVLAVLGGALGYPSQAREGAVAGDRGDCNRIIVRIEGDREEGREQQQR
jgi:tRNA(Ile)-lysidine synthetase-like protein